MRIVVVSLVASRAHKALTQSNRFSAGFSISPIHRVDNGNYIELSE